MDLIERPISVARRRAFIQDWFDWISRVGLVALGIAAIAVVTAKFVVLNIEYERWVQYWLLAAGAATLLIPPIIAFVQRPSKNRIASLIDQRLNLRERISSASLMSVAERETPMGAALWEDAKAKAEAIDVRDSFPIRVHSHLLRWIAPIAVIGCSFLLEDPSTKTPGNGSTSALTVTQVKNSVEPLLQQVKKERKAAEDAKLDEAELFKTLESQLENLRAQPPKDATKFMSELNKMQEKLEEKRREMGTGESLKKQLANIKKMDNGPAEELADAMKQGDMEEASEQVQQMMEKLQKGELTKEEQQKLSEQLSDMQKALEEAVKAHEQQKQQLEEQIKQAEAAGDKEKAAELSEKLESLKKSDSDMAAAKKLSESLSKCSECLSKGDQKSASEALNDMKQELSKMAKNAKQAQSMKELSENMNNSKKSSQCKACSGQGCSSCSGSGQSGQPKISKNAKGEGRGAGPREEEKNDTSDFDSQVRGNVGQGETAFGGKIEGQNKKTNTQIEVKEAILNAEVEDPDPIEQARLPKKERDVSKEYMDAIRTGK